LGYAEIPALGFERAAYFHVRIYRAFSTDHPRPILIAANRADTDCPTAIGPDRHCVIAYKTLRCFNAERVRDNNS
jgi:hypothetical protein